MKEIQLSLFLILFHISLYAQNTNEQIELKIENDKLIFADRYYTGGHFVKYKKSIDQNFIFKNTEKNKLLVSFSIGNEIYTPKNLSSFNVNDFDRPFAGWLFGSVEVGNVLNSSAQFLTLESGITGKESLSGDLQVWFHEVLGLDNFTSWEEEIGFKWLFNLKYRYLHSWKLNTRNNIQYEVSPAIGTKDIFIENNIHYFFGKFNELKNSSRLGVIDATNSNEFFGLVSLGHRYVAHNTLLQGSIFKEDLLFTTNSTKHLFKFKLGTVFKSKRNTFRLLYNFNSKETTRSISHGYGTLMYSRDF